MLSNHNEDSYCLMCLHINRTDEKCNSHEKACIKPGTLLSHNA